MLIRVAESGPVHTYAQSAAAMRELLFWQGSPGEALTHPLLFPSFQDEYLPVLSEFIVFSGTSPCKTLILSKLPELPELPEGDFTFGALTSDDIPTVVANWPYSHLYPEGGVPLVTDLVTSGPTMCARVGGAPVCWIVTYQDSSIGMLHTLKQWRRAALAQHVIARLSRALLQHGLTPYCHVLVENVASLKLFARLGFVQAGDVSWVRSASNKARL